MSFSHFFNAFIKRIPIQKNVITHSTYFLSLEREFSILGSVFHESPVLRRHQRDFLSLERPPFFSTQVSQEAPRRERLDHGDEREASSPVAEDNLRNRIFRLRFPKRSAVTALERWVGEGKPVSQAELRLIVKDLKKSQRYKHALEISEWMEGREEFKFSEGDYTVRIDLITKVLGVDAANEYFENVPLIGKTVESYTALLHSYAAEKQTEKAERLVEEIQGSGLTLSVLPYNELMTLYIHIGQLDKVHLVIEEVKKHKVSPDLFTYNLWTSACAATLDIDGVQRILNEMRSDSSFGAGWEIYIKLVNIYLSVGHLQSAENAVVEAEIKTTQREWITYDFLIILYTGLNKKDGISKIWKSLRMMSQKMTSRSFMCVISSYILLGHMKEAGDAIDEWKTYSGPDFDFGVCNRLLDTYVRTGLTNEAEALRQLLIEYDYLPAIDTLTQ
ncbi:pentatricopeptide repeat-containing protein At5g09450, mitochondrial isoform X2 [Amborella trichopoda]|uniref:pentatricopeptide repeat-containing protein At5g09450, mitochondrial isoform X2 n=1 Tax=Amborella trichopoda TaxID=13333 RepID=UPI0005D2F1E9|nr:pentatricopeptide repeat-containing protein At5g09450, mitochondrial isoform X2 [Amborella trichopoda]|eukprot:XP_011622176.1 pentatricopeptide repeat-containing protein At5g09450, mitochondrial isoform X2 [Amborella trichopoda]